MANAENVKKWQQKAKERGLRFRGFWIDDEEKEKLREYLMILRKIKKEKKEKEGK